MELDISAITGKHVVLYDGVCGLCNGLNQFLLPRDKYDQFRFAALQSDFAERELNRFGKSARDLDTFYVIGNFRLPSETLYERAAAGLFVLNRVGGLYAATGILHLLPTSVLNWGYDRLAKSRYAIFGKHDSCAVPTPEYQSKFVDSGAGLNL